MTVVIEDTLYKGTQIFIESRQIVLIESHTGSKLNIPRYSFTLNSEIYLV